MTFQAYLDTIKAKTGKWPDELRVLAAARGLVGPDVKATAVYDWLNAEFGLGRGHAMAIYSILKADGTPRATSSERLDKLFSASRAPARALLDAILARLDGLGEIGLAPTDTYVSLTRDGAKFAILQPAAKFSDIGIKLKSAGPTERFAAAGSWNLMVTHRMRLAADTPPDDELLDWLRRAYAEAGQDRRPTTD